MACDRLRQAFKGAGLRSVLLICLALLWGGCGIPKPPVSQEAQTLKENLLGEMDHLTERLVEPVSNQDWHTARQILQESYQETKKKGKPVPAMIVILDGKGITQVRFPARLVKRFDFSNYKPAKVVFDKKKKTQAVLYFKEGKIFVLIAPLLQNNKLQGAVAFTFPAAEVQEKWKVSEEEFLNLNFN